MFAHARFVLEVEIHAAVRFLRLRPVRFNRLFAIKLDLLRIIVEDSQRAMICDNFCSKVVRGVRHEVMD